MALQKATISCFTQEIYFGSFEQKGANKGLPFKVQVAENPLELYKYLLGCIGALAGLYRCKAYQKGNLEAMSW